MSLTSSHWGVYEVVRDGSERAVGLKAFAQDPDPSDIGLSVFDAATGPLRVQKPAVRLSWLRAQRARQAGQGSTPTAITAQEGATHLRGQEPFVEVPWDEALDLVAASIRDAIAEHGNESLYAGSYGWSSAGRFHHAQSQVHRFFNAVGGYVRHTTNYSFGAAQVLMPHVVAPMDQLITQHTSWDVLAEHCELFVSFGGVPRRNVQVSAGGPSEHKVRDGLYAMQAKGVRFVSVSPHAADLDHVGEHEWLAIRPHSDTALLLALAHVVFTEGLHNLAFLEKYCVGFEHVARYLTGELDGEPKTPAWAEARTDIPADRIVALARDMASRRTMINIAWSLQRAHHGEQPYWMVVTLASMLGQIGLPGGGFGVGYGATSLMGNNAPLFSGPTLPQGRNPVRAFIPVARLTDMLEQPGAAFSYDGDMHRYPHIHLVYWAGGNPYHHHQDLNRLMRAWRKPGAVIVHEQFWTATARMADVVLPATTSLERDDIGYSNRDRFIIAMKQAIEPVGEARDDYDIFAGLAARLGAEAVYTEGRTSQQWLKEIYTQSVGRAQRAGVSLPDFDSFWAQDSCDLGSASAPVVMLSAFRADPVAHPLATPSGRIELFSDKVAGFGYSDCGGQARWFEPVEWLGSPQAAEFPLHMLSNQPIAKLHSQYDHGALSQKSKVGGREPILMSPADAQARGIGEGDVVRVFNARGQCLAVAQVTPTLRTGVVKLSTGAWFDPVSWGASDSLEKHGNPNVLTRDQGASSLSQGCMAQTCLVQVEPAGAQPPAVTAFELPILIPDSQP